MADSRPGGENTSGAGGDGEDALLANQVANDAARGG